jgi:sec-independent protein translocase protein TatA
MIGMPGPMELTIIAIIAILLFGNRLPKVARSLGSTVTEFKKGVRDVQDVGKEVSNEINKEVKEIKG